MPDFFVHNLDDGELWLPSELISDVGLSRYRLCSGAFPGTRVLRESEVECLTNKLLPFGTFDRLHLRRGVKQPLAVPLPFEVALCFVPFFSVFFPFVFILFLVAAPLISDPIVFVCRA